MDSDIVKLVNEHLDIIIKNDTLVVKNLVQNISPHNSYFELIKNLLIALLPLIGIYFGYKLNKSKEVRIEAKKNLGEFKNELAKCNDGSGGYSSVLIAFSNLSKEDKIIYSAVQEYDGKNATEKYELIKTLLSK